LPDERIWNLYMQKLQVKEVRFSSDVDLGGRGGLVKLINDKTKPRITLYLNEYRFIVIEEDGFEDVWVPLENVNKLTPCQTEQTYSSKSKKLETSLPKTRPQETETPGKLF